MDAKKTLPGDIRIVASGADTGEDIIPALMRVEQEVYRPEDRGSYEAIRARFERFREMFFLAYRGEELIGYLCWFPITERLYREVMDGTGFFDDNIEPEDVCSFSEGAHIYLISVALKPTYQNMGAADAMLEMLLERLRAEKLQGRGMADMLASVVSEDGRRFAERFGFQRVFAAEDGRFALYRKEGTAL